MIHKFTIEKDGKIYECEREVTGKGEIRQTVHVIGIGSEKDSAIYGASKHSAMAMLAAAKQIGLKIINGDQNRS